MKSAAEKKNNCMRDIRIEKVIVNLCTGESGDRLTKASKVITDLSKQSPVEGKARYTIRTFGIRRNEKISVSCTMRGDHAEDLLKRGLKVKDYELKRRNFSDTGNFGFGIEEHIDLGLKYDPSTGIFGMDFYVVLRRAGTRVKYRKSRRSRLGVSQNVTKEDAMQWFQEKLGGTLLKN